MGRARVEDLPRNNAVAAQIEVHQGASARDPDGILRRLSERLGGPEHRALRMAFIEWVRQSVAPGMVPKAPNLKSQLKEIAELGELQDMKSLVLKSMEDYWQGLVDQEAARTLERARADERARLCRLAGRKFGGRAQDRLSAVIEGVTESDRLTEVGDWVIDCDTEAEFLAHLQPRS